MEKEIVISGLHRDMTQDTHDTVTSPEQTNLSSPQSPGTPDTLMPSRQDTKLLDDNGRAIGMGAVEGKKSGDAAPFDPPQPKQPQILGEGVGKGHARDPLSDKIILNVGPGLTHFSQSHDGATDDLANLENPSDAPFVIAESPAGLEDSECNIYETAYQDEVRRILAQKEREKAESPTKSTPPVVLHLTKQVEHLAELRNHPNIVEGSEIAKGFMKEARGAAGDFAGVVRQAADRAHALARELPGERHDEVSAVDRTGVTWTPSEIIREGSSIFEAVKASTSSLWQRPTKRNPSAPISSTTAAAPSEPRSSSETNTAFLSTSTSTNPRSATELAFAASSLSQKVLASLWQPSAMTQQQREQQQNQPTSPLPSTSSRPIDPHTATSHSSDSRPGPSVNPPRNSPAATPSRVFSTVAERMYNRAEKFGNVVVDVAGRVDEFKAQQQRQRECEQLQRDQLERDQQRREQAGTSSFEADARRSSSVASNSTEPVGATGRSRGGSTGKIVLKKSLELMRKRFSREGL
jgi:hypothetical protein